MDDKKSRKGRCRNYGECEKAGQEFSIEEGKPFECPECHQPLTPLDGPLGKRTKKSIGKQPMFIAILAVVIVGIIVVLFYMLRTPGDVSESQIIDSTIMETPIDDTETDTTVSAEESKSLETLKDTQSQAKEQKAAPKSETSMPIQEKSKPSTSNTHKLSYGSWNGGWKNGQPHGNGTLTYSTATTIDSRDPKGRVAQPGEYIVGEWDNGHLVQGRWFKNDGTKEAVIIGKAG